MISLINMNIINWYGFTSEEIIPIGNITLITGANASGKSVLLDAIRFGLHGETQFNKATDSRSSRTVLSYTRGLINKGKNTYMRPAHDYPYVYSYLLFELHDVDNDNFFVLGTVIETNPEDVITTKRFVINNMRLQDVKCTYEIDEDSYLYTMSEFQEKYGVKYDSSRSGLLRFSDCCGLKFDDNQMKSYKKKMSNIIKFSPSSNIDQFVRDYVLPENSVDPSKLIDMNNDIEELLYCYNRINQECDALENIDNLFNEYRILDRNILKDDIKRKHKECLELQEKKENAALNIDSLKKENERLGTNLEDVLSKIQSASDDVANAKSALNNFDVSSAVNEAKSRLAQAEKDLNDCVERKNALEDFEARINEAIEWCREKGIVLSDTKILASLMRDSFSNVQKQNAVTKLVSNLESFDEKLGDNKRSIRDSIDKNKTNQNRNRAIIENSTGRLNNDNIQIIEATKLKEDINRKFREDNINSEAKLAYEYVSELTDEIWRNSIESFLGRSRFTVLVEPRYYDIADQVMNERRYKSAHLFNTKLLDKKDIKVETDSVVNYIVVNNNIAKKYFQYKLGRFHAVSISEVKNYENAISSEGKISVSMDNFFLNEINFYCLGQEAIALNRENARSVLRDLEEEENRLLNDKIAVEADIKYLKLTLSLLKNDVDFEANNKYIALSKEVDVCRNRYDKLIRDLENDEVFNALNDVVQAAENEMNELIKSHKLLNVEREKCVELLADKKAKYDNFKDSLDDVLKKLNEYKGEHIVAYENAISEYDSYIKTGNASGGLLNNRSELENKRDSLKEELIACQGKYNLSYGDGNNDLPIGVDSQENYHFRREKIWVNDRESVETNLNSLKCKFEDIFKKEFVLTIYNNCEYERANIRKLNSELSKLGFKDKYSFEAKFINDNSNFSKIINYARFLKNTTELQEIGLQRTMFSLEFDNEFDEASLENSMKEIVDEIISSDEQELIDKYVDYRNYMVYEIYEENEYREGVEFSKQIDYNSGAEIQIPFLLIMLSSLLMVYRNKNSTRLVFIDEPFTKMDPLNVKTMLKFMKEQNLQVVLCTPDKLDLIGNESDVIISVLSDKNRCMEANLGFTEFISEESDGF